MIKGLPDEEAVLCTRKATYSIKKVETTNSLFMVPDASQSVSVTATAGSHLELSLAAPQFSLLDKVLKVSITDKPCLAALLPKDTSMYCPALCYPAVHFDPRAAAERR
jgi:hypothetical protein